jgi:NACalpha-BTF3-like transcription factor
MYSPLEGVDIDELDGIIEIDCRPLILTELVNRQERAGFDSFINHHIEYQPYISNIYSQSYPTGNVRVAKPPIGWTKANTVRDKYYFDEIFFYLHMHLANLYNNNQPGVIATSSMSNSSNYFANNNNKVSTLMAVLSDRLKMMLQPSDNIDEVGIDANDIELVMNQVNCSRKQAINALRRNNNDVVNAVMSMIEYSAWL